MTRPDVLDRIQKLMSKTTGNGATEAEAQTALAMAQGLMDQHNIQVAEIESQSGESHAYGQFMAWESDTAHSHVVMVLPVLDECFSVRTVVKKLVRKTAGNRTKVAAVQILIFGDAANVQSATWALKFLSGTFRGLWNAYRLRTASKTSAMVGYYGGLQAGFLEKIRGQRVEADRQLPGTKNALAVIADKLDGAFDDTFPTARAITKASRDNSAYADGVKDGAEINLARSLGEGQKKLQSA